MPLERVEAPEKLVSTVARLRTSPTAVLDQGIRWRPERWFTTKLASHKAVIAQLAEHTEPRRESTERIIRRRHVLDLADDDAVAVFLAAMIFGHGVRGYGPDRVGDIVQGSGTELRPKLDGLVAAARAGPNETWEALSRTHKIRGLGPAFATKVAYFASFGSYSAGPRPLIADANTSWAMWDLVGLPRSVERRDSYLRYVDLAHQWADDYGWRADDVEWALFKIGKDVARR